MLFFVLFFEPLINTTSIGPRSHHLGMKNHSKQYLVADFHIIKKQRFVLQRLSQLFRKPPKITLKTIAQLFPSPSPPLVRCLGRRTSSTSTVIVGSVATGWRQSRNGSYGLLRFPVSFWWILILKVIGLQPTSSPYQNLLWVAWVHFQTAASSGQGYVSHDFESNSYSMFIVSPCCFKARRVLATKGFLQCKKGFPATFHMRTSCIDTVSKNPIKKSPICPYNLPCLFPKMFRKTSQQFPEIVQ